MEPGDTWGRGEGWANVKELIEFGKRSDGSEWNAERREQILQRVLARTERARERRRLVHAFAAGASTIVVVGLLLRLIGVGWPTQRRQADVVGKIARSVSPPISAEDRARDAGRGRWVPLIGSQAFQETPRRHAPAVVIALFPSLAAWGKLQIDNSLSAISGINLVTPEMVGKMQQVGIMYHGLSILGGGSILAGVILGATTTCVIDRNFSKAAGFAAAGGALTFLGLMHGEEVGAFQNPTVVVAYFAIATVLYACSRLAVVAPLPASASAHEEHGMALE